MYRILKIGIDVHSKTYSICALEPVFGQEDCVIASTQSAADYKNIIMFIESLKLKLGCYDEYDIECGYEAGCLGYSLYNQLTSAGIKCTILAPTTMLTENAVRVKTDARDARRIAQCLAYGGYNAVYVPTEEDDSVKEYLRMRDDHQIALKKLKQQINAFCLRHGYYFGPKKWTGKHIAWLKTLKLAPLYQEILDEYMASYYELSAKVERLDRRIEELASESRYLGQTKKLICLLGIKTHIALSLVVETGDFNRFKKANTYAAYLGLAPGERSSGNHIRHTGITKAGNSHLRSLLIEAAGGICKGTIGYKSKDLRSRQAGNSADVIAYADKANVRLRRKFYRYIRHGKKRNVAVAAIARELACFVWGLMTDNIGMAV